jgi:mono/diheme cytochrome c family protein
MKKLLILTTLAALPLAACSGGGSEGGGDSGASAVAAGKAAFSSNGCVVCHGETGMGDGIGAVALNPKPRNYSDAAWQAGTTDEQIKAVISKGGKANGLSEAMVAYPQISAEDLDNIVAYIRSLKQ